MRPANFTIVVILATLMVFLYTHQRIEAARLSYEINERQLAFDKLLDREKELEYNVAKLKAPTYLELQLAKEDIKLVLPKRWQVFNVAATR